MIPREPGTLDLSVVIPIYNELDNLEPLVAELRSALDATMRSWEIVLADDASDDGSAQRAMALARADARVHSVRLAQRGGQSAALLAGLACSRGRVIVTLDADLQNDPRDLPRLLTALEHADVVSGIRAGRQDAWHRRASSSIANTIRRAVIRDSITDIGCSFKAYRRGALEALPAFAGVHRFLPALCQFRGARLAEVPVSHRARRHGRSKYGISNRLWRGICDLFGVRWLKTRLVSPADREEGA